MKFQVAKLRVSGNPFPKTHNWAYVYLLFPLKLEAVYHFRFLLAKIPQMEDIIGGCSYESALVNEKVDLNDGAITLVPDVDIHTRASQSRLLVKEINGNHKMGIKKKKQSENPSFLKNIKIISRENCLTYERKFKNNREIRWHLTFSFA